MSNDRTRITVPKFTAMKGSGRKICMLTAYDYPMAQVLDQAGVDAILIGDTLGMVVQGHDSTLPVTLDEMIYHAQMVGRGVEHALTVVDMPFPSYHLGPYRAVENAGRILKETRCQSVKLEGGADQAEVIATLVTAGIPVMAHIGLRPQSVHVLGGYKVQRDEDVLMQDARAAQEAGAYAIVLECIPAGIAQRITETLSIPTIGIGAGDGTDGQVLVTYDLLGYTGGHVPKFVKRYADLRGVITSAVKKHIDEIQAGEFPGPEQTFR